MTKYKVKFLPDEKEVEVAGGTTLLEAATKADVYINSQYWRPSFCPIQIPACFLRCITDGSPQRYNIKSKKRVMAE